MTSTMSTTELARRVDDPDSAPFVLDVRAPDQFARWRIDGKAHPATLNVPYWTALTDGGTVAPHLPPDGDVVVVCAHGGSSAMVVETLDLPNLRNLEGGMNAWAVTLVPHVLADDGSHVVVQLDRIAKACLSYVVAGRGDSMAVIDPAADLDTYLELARSFDATITHVFDTHLHADHISLARRLCEATGAEYHIAPGDVEGATFPHRPLEDGERFLVGEMEIVVSSVATPGHTPGSTSLEVDGRFLMTGDAVFVTGIGRPDLGGETEPWARDLFHTIHRRLASLRPGLEICPAHYSTREEAGPDGSVRRALGDLLANDPVVSIADEEEFVAYVVGHLGTPPPTYHDIRKVNMGWLEVDTEGARTLEVGRNECALSG